MGVRFKEDSPKSYRGTSTEVDPVEGKTVRFRADDEVADISDPRVIAETVADNFHVAHQASSLYTSDEMAGAAAALMEDPGFKDPDKMRRKYYEIRDKVRSRVGAARENSPVSTPITEILSPTPLDLLAPGASKVGMAKRIASSAPVQGAIAGFGAADSMEEVPENMIMGGGLGLAGSAVSYGSKLAFTNPLETRARALGSDSKAFQEMGSSNRENLVKRIKDTGFYKDSSTVMKFDPMTEKFVKTKNKVPSNMRPEEVYLRRAGDGISEANKAVDQVIAGNAGVMGYDDMLNHPSMVKAMQELQIDTMANPDMADAYQKISNKVKSVFGDKKYNLKEVTDLKRSLQKGASQGGAYSTVVDTTPSGAVSAKLSSAMNDIIADVAESSRPGAGDFIRRLNKRQSELLTLADDVSVKMGQVKASPIRAALPIGTGPFYAGAKAVENVGGATGPALLRADIGDLATSTGKYGRHLDRSVSKAPFRMLLPGQDQEQEGLNKWSSIPEMIIKTPIPRDSKSILANKEFVLEKVRMQMPMMYDAVADVVEKEPHKIPEILPMIIQAAPQLFEGDEYGRIDGKIIDPMQKGRAIEDTIKNDEMSNTEKVAMINNISTKGVM